MITQFQILDNIGLYNSYENQVDFNDKLSQDTFWGSKVIKYYDNTKLNFLNDNIIILTANFNEANKWSYARAFVTDDISHQSKLHYYFINSIKVRGTYDPTSKEQIIELELEEDVIQTYMFDYEIKESFVEREHQDRIDTTRKRLFSHTPENIFIPTNKKAIQTTELHAKDENGDYILSNLKYLVVQFTQPPKWSTGDPDSFSVLTTLMIPFIEGYPNEQIFLWNGTESITGLIASPTYNDVIKFLLDDTNIVSCNVVLCADCVSLQYNPNIGWLFQYDTTLYRKNGASVENGSETYTFYSLIPFKIVEKELGGFIDSKNILSVSVLPNYANDANAIYESKLYTSPFTEAILQLNTKTHIYDPSWLENFAVNYCVNTIGAVSEIFYPATLSENIDGTNTTIFNQSFSENEIPIEKNEWEQYLNENKASIRANQISQGIQLGTSLVSGAVGAASGNPLAIVGGAAGVLNSVSNIMKSAAQMQDLQNKNPSAINTGSSYFLYSNRHLNNCRWTINQIPESDLQRVFKFFNAYGYSALINKIPNLKSRYYFNFIKMKSNISGKLNVSIINKLKSIFANGLTIWHYRDASTFLFNDYSKENVEMNLLEAVDG